MKPSSGARALNWACGATGIVLVAAGLVAALITGFIAFILTAEGFHFFAGLAWFVTVMCVLAPFLFLYVYDEWQKKQGIHE